MTGPLAPLFARLHTYIDTDGLVVTTEDAREALSSIERHVQEDTEEWEQIAAEKGLPFLLDHLGLDGLANEVVARERHVQDMESAIEEWAFDQGYDSLSAERIAVDIRNRAAALPAREKEEE